MYINMFGCDQYGYDGMRELCVQPSPFPIISIIYNCVFVTLSSMMILNLFIGVITSSMAEAKTNLSTEAESEEPDPDFSQISARMDTLDSETNTLVRALREVIDVKATLVSARKSATPLPNLGEGPHGGAGDGAGLGDDDVVRSSPDLSSSGDSALVNPPRASSPLSPMTAHDSTGVSQRAERLFTMSQRKLELDATGALGGASRLHDTRDSKEAPPMRRLFRPGSARVTPDGSPVHPESVARGRGALLMQSLDK